MSGEHEYFIGLDLGQAQEFTALAVLERTAVGPGAPQHLRRPAYALRHLHRFPLGTPYPEVVATVRTLLKTPPLPHAVLGIDQTGVGQAVLQMFAEGLQHQVDCLFCPVTLTAGLQCSVGEHGGLLVPKKELVGVLQVLLQARRLQVPRALPEAALLVRELENFRVREVSLRNDSLESWRDGQNDDLVFAVALAAWLGEQGLPPLYDPVEEPIVVLRT